MAGPGVDYYGVLGVPVHADAAEIRRAYRRLLRSIHPDTRDGPEEPGQAGAGLALTLLREAFTVLGDPARRAAYDRRAQPERTPPRRSSASASGRRYPTDPSDPPLRAGPVRYRPSRPDRS